MEVEVGHPPAGTTVGIVAQVFGACKIIACTLLETGLPGCKSPLSVILAVVAPATNWNQAELLLAPFQEQPFTVFPG